MIIYQVVNSKISGDEFVDYTGADAEKAKRIAFDSWNSLSAGDQKRCTVKARIYEIPDGTDVADEDELTNALCENPDYDTLAEYSQETNAFAEKLRDEVETSLLETEEFAERLGVSSATLYDLLNGIEIPEKSEREKILKRAEEVSERALDED